MNANLPVTVCILLNVSLLLSVSGCSDTATRGNATVQGTVTIDGALAPRGTVTFYPKNNGPVAVGQIYSDGSYALRVGLGNTSNPDSAKIASGEYVATVMVMGESPEGETVAEGGPPLAGPRLIAKKYTTKETSGLTFSVKPGRNVFVLDLEGAASDPLEELKPESIEDSSSVSETDAEQAEEEKVPAVSDADPDTAVEPESTDGSDENSDVTEKSTNQ